MSVLLKNAKYLTEDCRTWSCSDILIDGDRIAAIGSAADSTPADEIVDCSKMAVVPGFINSHAHSYTGFLKGTIDGMPLDIYMLYAIAGGSCRSDREIYVSAKIQALDMLKHGTTAVVDHFSQRPTLSLDGIDNNARAFSDLGMRCRVATMYADKGFFQTLPMAAGELPAEFLPKGASGLSVDEYISLVEQAYLRYKDDPLIDVTLGTDGPQRCSDQLLLRHAELEDKYKMGWETHVLEAKTQAVVSRNFYGKGLIEHMSELGILNNRSALVHHVWVSDREIDLVARSGATVVHCPSSNLHLGSGICPVDLCRRAGITVALGSDGGNCGGISMLEQIRLAARLQNIAQPDYEKWISADQALEMDYYGGAAIFGKDIGRIAVGAQADICLIRTDNISWQPVNDMTRQLVYYETGSNVDTVFIAGKKVLEHGKSLFVDESELIAEANELCEKLRRDCSEAMELVGRQIPYMCSMYLREISRNIGINRFSR